MLRNIFYVILLILLLFLVLIGIKAVNFNFENGHRIAVVNIYERNDVKVSIPVSVASTYKQITQGLSDTTSLRDDSGMLFIFDKPDTYGFWMKDMNYSLDIIWIDAANKIIDIDKNISPDTYPKNFYPGSPVHYVLEVNAGFSDKNKINIGDTVQVIEN